VACYLLFNGVNTRGYEADEGVSKAVKGRPFKFYLPSPHPSPLGGEGKGEGEIKGGRDG